jgi:hypothetical protein
MTPKLPTERSFGLGVGGVFSGVGALQVGFGLVAPMALLDPNLISSRVAQAIGWVNTRILLTVFFAVVLTPVGVVMRLFGRNPLRGTGVRTNWTSYPARRRDSRHYERLF